MNAIIVALAITTNIAMATNVAIATNVAMTTTVPFSDIKPIFVSRCSMCHQSMGERNWEVETNVLSHKALIIEKLQDQSMPPGNVTNMTDSERSTVLSWLRSL